MATKKKTKKAKSTAPLKDVVSRVYGPTVFTMNNVDQVTARILIDDHGFRLGQRDDGNGAATLWADKIAYDSWKA